VLRALIIHYKPAEAADVAARLHQDGFEPAIYQHQGPKGFRSIREGPPDVILIDLRSMPSYGRAMGALLRESKSLRTIPLVFLEGDPEKTVLVRRMLPDAIVASWVRIGPALRKAVERPAREPVAPVAPDRPLYRKLRIGEGSVVALLQAPRGIKEQLGAPKGVRFQHHTRNADLVLLFVKSAAALGRELPSLAAIGRGLWVCWPKKTSGHASDLTMPRIREMCQPYRLVDNKVVSIDQTWSAMAFARRAS